MQYDSTHGALANPKPFPEHSLIGRARRVQFSYCLNLLESKLNLWVVFTAHAWHRVLREFSIYGWLKMRGKTDPYSSSQYPVSRCGRYGKSSCKFTSSRLCRSIKFPQSLCLRLAEFCHRVIFAVEARRWTAATLALLVGVVFQYSAQPKVLRIDTRRIVATGAVVQNTETVRNCPAVNQPAYAMRLNRNVAFCTSAHTPVALRVQRAFPQPTEIGFLDKPPESINEIFRQPLGCENWIWVKKTFSPKAFASVWNPATLFLHNQFDWLCRASGCFSTAGAFLFWDNSPMLFNYKLRLALNHERRAAVRPLHHVLVTGRGLGHSAFYPLVLVQTR